MLTTAIAAAGQLADVKLVSDSAKEHLMYAAGESRDAARHGRTEYRPSCATPLPSCRGALQGFATALSICQSKHRKCAVYSNHSLPSAAAACPSTPEHAPASAEHCVEKLCPAPPSLHLGCCAGHLLGLPVLIVLDQCLHKQQTVTLQCSTTALASMNAHIGCVQPWQQTQPQVPSPNSAHLHAGPQLEAVDNLLHEEARQRQRCGDRCQREALQQ